MWNALTPDIKLSATVNVFQENVVSFAARELQVLKLRALIIMENLLIKLKGTFFDTAVGSRPNFARMCG